MNGKKRTVTPRMERTMNFIRRIYKDQNYNLFSLQYELFII
jgi:hypothetical protein